VEINVEIIDQTEDTVPTDELYHIDHDRWIAEQATAMGFPIAGFVGDIYEDAVVMIPPNFRFDWTKGKVKAGRVIRIHRPDHDLDEDDKFYSVIHFVLLTDDGIQIPCSYGHSYNCFFALPEDSENFAVKS
jgi:hypothetical protein